MQKEMKNVCSRDARFNKHANTPCIMSKTAAFCKSPPPAVSIAKSTVWIPQGHFAEVAMTRQFPV
jgi:hypothetical protein